MHPVLMEWGPLKLYSYGFFAGVAMIVALLIAEYRAKHFGFEKTQIADLVFALFIFGIVGARLLYVCLHWDEYALNPISIFWIREGGLIWYGGFFGAVIMGTVYARWRGWPVLRLCDFFAPIMTLSHAIGRVGCFMNGCCFGRKFYEFGRVPAQLVEAAALFVLSVILFRYAKKKPRDGEVFLSYLIGYSLIRFGVEYLRGDNGIYLFFSLPQWMSLGLFAGALTVKLAGTKKK